MTGGHWPTADTNITANLLPPVMQKNPSECFTLPQAWKCFKSATGDSCGRGAIGAQGSSTTRPSGDPMFSPALIVAGDVYSKVKHAGGE